VRTIFTGPAGSPWLSTLHFDGAEDTEAVAANADVGQFWGAVDAFMSNLVTWTTTGEVEVFNPATGDISAIHAVTPIVGVGALAADMMPPICQGLIKLRTGIFVSSREIRGRVFVPGLTETGNDSDGTVAGATITGINAAATTLIGDTANWVVWSREHGQVATVATATLQPKVAKMTSRRD
jgi:hypothetical protein